MEPEEIKDKKQVLSDSMHRLMIEERRLDKKANRLRWAALAIGVASCAALAYYLVTHEIGFFILGNFLFFITLYHTVEFKICNISTTISRVWQCVGLSSQTMLEVAKLLSEDDDKENKKDKKHARKN